jgi:hypothetical protein
MLCVAAAVWASAAAKEPRFEQVFAEKGEPSALHYQATYNSRGAEHRLEVWRDGGNRLKRRTDDAIETYVFRKAGEAEFSMSILDMKKRIHTRVDRTNLYRIGNFTDWFDLAHGLRHPIGEYRIAKIQPPPDAPKAIKTCEWYDLSESRSGVRVCWNARSHLPLLIQSRSGEIVWRVLALDTKPIPANAFEIHDEGFVRNDANRDIEGD